MQKFHRFFIKTLRMEPKNIACVDGKRTVDIDLAPCGSRFFSNNSWSKRTYFLRVAEI